MEKYEINKFLEKFNINIKNLRQTIDLDKINAEIDELTNKMSEANFWNNQSESEDVISRLNALKSKSQIITDINIKYQDVLDSFELFELEENEDSLMYLSNLIIDFDKELEEKTIKLMLDGPYDYMNCFLDIHPGAGGTDAMDWALMLFRMYKRYAERNNFKLEVLDYLPGSDAGLKSATIKISGENAYGFLKGERGVHRLVRISPFDSSKARHTSFASVDVSPIINNPTGITIDPNDLKIDVYHSSGAGGQSVNTTDSAVRITHLPTGIVVTCQNERSQIQNREQAMTVLKSKLMEIEIEREAEKLKALKGETLQNAFGSQIRSYVFCPYTLVKDHRTNVENTNVNNVMDGDLESFIYGYLRKEKKENE